VLQLEVAAQLYLQVRLAASGTLAVFLAFLEEQVEHVDFGGGQVGFELCAQVYVQLLHVVVAVEVDLLLQDLGVGLESVAVETEGLQHFLQGADHDGVQQGLRGVDLPEVALTLQPFVVALHALGAVSVLCVDPHSRVDDGIVSCVLLLVLGSFFCD